MSDKPELDRCPVQPYFVGYTDPQTRTQYRSALPDSDTKEA
jgi:hypothetical protein